MQSCKNTPSMAFSVFVRKLTVLAMLLSTVLADAYENVTGIVSGDIVTFKLNPSKASIDRRWPNVEYYRSKNLKLTSETERKLIGSVPAGSVALNYFKNFLEADALVLWN